MAVAGLLFAGLLLPAPPAAAAGDGRLPAEPVVHVPAGTYHPTELRLEGLRTLRGGFRGGDLMIGSPRSVREDMGHLRLAGGKIGGEFTHEGQRTQRIVVDGWVAPDGTVSGSWRPKTGEGPGGRLTGWVLTGEQMAARNAVDRSKSWPCWSGPYRSLAAQPIEAAFIGRLDGIRLVWRSEDPVPQGPGNTVPFLRMGGYIRKALSSPTGGGGATPVIADGRVYVYYIQPTHDGPHHEEAIRALKQIALGAALRTISPAHGQLRGGSGEADELLGDGAAPAVERNVRVNPYAAEKYAILADEVVVCLDAATGATLWRTVFPRAGVNKQDHKQGPVNCTPCVAGGRVFATGTTGRVYGLDARTGKTLWAALMPTAGAVSSSGGYIENFNQAPVMAGGVLLVPDHRFTLYGFDPATGKQRWRLANGVGRMAPVMAFTASGREFALTLCEPDPAAGEAGAPVRLRCIDPQTGAVRWSHEGPFWCKNLVVEGDVAVVEANSEESVHMDVIGLRLSADGAVRIWKTPLDGRLVPSVHFAPVAYGGRVYLSGLDATHALDAATGKILATAAGPGAANEGMGVLFNDRLLIRCDGCHGGSAMVLFAGGPAGGLECRPVELPGPRPAAAGPTHVMTLPYPSTTTYHMRGMALPVVDGRLYVRGSPGVYCFDLRQSTSRRPGEAGRP